MKWFIRIVQGLLAAVYLMSGFMKMFVSDEEIRTLYTEMLGYGVGFMRTVGAVEALAAIGLLLGYRWPRIAFLSSVIIAIIMAGAVVSLLVSGHGAMSAALPFVLLALAIVVLSKTPKPGRLGTSARRTR